MKTEAGLFAGLMLFMLISAIGYGFWTHFGEWVGGIGLTLVAGLCGMISFYLWYTGKRVGTRPEDRHDAEVHEGSGEQGFFSPWSWWPALLAVACGCGFLGLAVAWWIVFIGGALAAVALIGWVFEYSRGHFSH